MGASWLWAGQVKLWVSADGAASFKVSSFPYQLSERSYRVVDSKEGSVFVQVTVDHQQLTIVS